MSNVLPDFNYDKAKTLKTNDEIKTYAFGYSIPDQFCYCSTEWVKDFYLTFDIKYASKLTKVDAKPIACFLKFNQSITEGASGSYDVKKLKGTNDLKDTKNSSFNTDISNIINGCDSKLSITSGYTYSGNDLVQEYFTPSTLNVPAKLQYVFQSKIIYAFKTLDLMSGTFEDCMKQYGIKHYFTSGNDSYFFITVYRDHIFSVNYSHDLSSTIAPEDLCKYLADKGYSKWK